ncbi:MAG TPA: pyridoxal-dependent decarboxylase [Rhodanobacteraceae bacterium]|nr:pyridoxal-dependent decarboxylase [Rhodanobacteraceae bacterium]
MSDPILYPCFLGPYGENDGLLEKLVVEFLRDHVYWRRNFHPEDPPAIPTDAASSPEYREFESRLRRELHALSAALKRSVPSHNPRYIGHMVSDLLLPALAAQFLVLPYNPNNISGDTAPVTVDLEIKIGLQLARLFGYPDDPGRPDCAFGHLTSGGTLANLQALRLALAMKAFPVALRAAAPTGLATPKDDWTAFNLPPAAIVALLDAWETYLTKLPPAERRSCVEAVACQRIETLGHADFFYRHPEIHLPIVIAPASAHYSWRKGMQLLGLGAGRLVPVPQRDARIDADALDALLADAEAKRRPVLLCVGMLGTTEYGAIDPIDRLVEARDRCAATGFGFAVHVDAAWGGYLATLFRRPDGSLRGLAEMRAEYGRFPSPATHAAVAALSRTDSATIDPHKQGYAPYGAGAFVCRDQRAAALLAIDASYVFTQEPEADYFARFRQPGRYIIEGSRPGAMAASVYVTHRVLPLDHEHFGRLPAQTLRAADDFVERARHFASACADQVRACLPFAPDSNLVCLALNPLDNTTIGGANAFVDKLYESMSIDPAGPVQTREFFGSTTTMRLDALDRDTAHALLECLHLPAALAGSSEPLRILRHTLMNPFLLDTENGIDYIGRYFEFLEKRVRVLANASVGLVRARGAALSGRDL